MSRRQVALGALTGIAVLAVAALAVLPSIVWPSPRDDPHLAAAGTSSAPVVVSRVTISQRPSPSPSPSPTPVVIPELTGPTQPANPPPPPPPPPPPRGYIGPPATNPTEAVANAYAAGTSLQPAATMAVALLDLQSGTLYGSPNIDRQFASASVVKVFIATRLLVDGEAADPAVQDLMWKMITCSDDDAGSKLYILAGSESLVGWVQARYGISGLAPANIPNYWGLTRITARAMTTFYADVAGDPAVAPWLLNAMANVQEYGCDGYREWFGIPDAANDWMVKQGWMCCLENLTRLHSTGYVDQHRYAVAMLTAGPRSYYEQDAGATLTMMAQALMPDGVIPGAA